MYWLRFDKIYATYIGDKYGEDEILFGWCVIIAFMVALWSGIEWLINKFKGEE